MKDVQLDPIVARWLSDGPDEGREHALGRALAATRKVNQRPGWTFPRWWLPRPVADLTVRLPRQAALGLLLVLTLLAILALAVAFGARIPPAPLLLAPTDDVIAFADSGVIYVARPDGSDRKQLSGSELYATAPAFSPDGSRVAYLASTNPDLPGGRLVIDSVDGSSSRVQTSDDKVVLSGDIANFSWSPDSQRIAFSAMDGAFARIFVVDTDGTEIRPITDGSVQSDLPSWSPVGQWLDFTGEWIAYRVAQPELSETRFERIHPDGTGLEVVAAVVGPGSSLGKLSWSPVDSITHGSSMSYAMNAGFGSETRAVIDAGVGHAMDIWTNGVGGFADAAVPWSPDSRYLALISADHELVLAENDKTTDQYNGQVRRLGQVLDCWVDWSPNSAYLYGGSPNGCEGVVVVPLEDPAAASVLTNDAGTASWRRIH